MRFVGKQLQPIKNVMIVGGTPLAMKTAKLIEDEYRVTIVMKNKEREKKAAEHLRRTLIIWFSSCGLVILLKMC